MKNGLIVSLVQGHWKVYQSASRAEKTRILDLIQRCSRDGGSCGVSRKHLIKLFGQPQAGLPQPAAYRRGRPRVYSDTVVHHIVRLHRCMLGVCAQRMKVALPYWLSSYEQHYGCLTPEIRTQLKNISSASIGRIISRYNNKQKGKSTTRPNEKMKSVIPLKRLDEQVTAPGTIQADTVAHCGNSTQGEYVNTLTCTDIYTHWTENQACWTKSSSAIVNAIERIEMRTPIQFKKFDTDCGTEFLNRHVMGYLAFSSIRKRTVELRRARPYKKNDQCYVEQRNNTHVRELIGYDRLDDPGLVDIVNQIYALKNKLNNYFLPTFKLANKHREGGKIKKKFEVLKTPAQRLLGARSCSKFIKAKLEYDLVNFDPIELKKQLEQALKIFNQKVDALKRVT